ncbi:MAG: hypothetical protein ACYDFT_00820 [Thermoplasmata archaeon]
MRRRGRPPVAASVVTLVVWLRDRQFQVAAIALVVGKTKRSVEWILYRYGSASKTTHNVQFVSTAPAIQPALAFTEVHE